MSGLVRVAVLTPDAVLTIHHVHQDVHEIKALIGGGWLEAFGLGGLDDSLTGSPSFMAHGYADEEGQLKGLPVNPIATGIAGHPVVGTVVFAGHDASGDETDVPAMIETVLKTACELYTDQIKRHG